MRMKRTGQSGELSIPFVPATRGALNENRDRKESIPPHRDVSWNATMDVEHAKMNIHVRVCVCIYKEKWTSIFYCYKIVSSIFPSVPTMSQCAYPLRRCCLYASMCLKSKICVSRRR